MLGKLAAAAAAATVDYKWQMPTTGQALTCPLAGHGKAQALLPSIATVTVPSSRIPSSGAACHVHITCVTKPWSVEPHAA